MTAVSSGKQEFGVLGMWRDQKVLIWCIRTPADSSTLQRSTRELRKQIVNKSVDCVPCLIWNPIIWMIACISGHRVASAVWSTGCCPLITLSCVTYFDQSRYRVWLEEEPEFVVVNNRHVFVLCKFSFSKLNVRQCPALWPQLACKLGKKSWRCSSSAKNIMFGRQCFPWCNLDSW